MKEVLASKTRPEEVVCLSVEGLRCSRGRDATVLGPIDLKLGRSERLAVVGPNGAGKTTLLYAILKLIPSEGKIFFHSMEVTRSVLPEFRKKVGFVFEDGDDQLFSATVLEDVLFGPLNLGLSEKEALEASREVLLKVGASYLESRSPATLSTGEKKRVALATVLVMKPEVLLLDEPTAGLDPGARKQLLEILQCLNIPLLFTTHDLDMALKFATGVLVLKEGKIIASGKPEKILGDEKLMCEAGLEVPLSFYCSHSVS